MALRRSLGTLPTYFAGGNGEPTHALFLTCSCKLVQAEGSPEGASDSTELEETVTMEAIACPDTGDLESHVYHIEKAIWDKLGDAVRMLQDLAGAQREQGERLEAVAGEIQVLATRIVDLEARLQNLESGAGGPRTSKPGIASLDS